MNNKSSANQFGAFCPYLEDVIYIIGDVHGCFKTLKALITKLPKKINSKICFVGDVIDRGKNSADVIEFIIENGYDCVLGNHEYRLLNFKNEFLSDDKVSDERWFYQNGGMQTFASYYKKEDLKQKHIEFLEKLPIFLHYNNLKTKDGRELVVSHSAVGKFWQFRFDKNYEAEFRKHVLCARDDTFENKEIFNVYGHNPQDSPIITAYSANIDLGCVYSHKFKFPRLCAIEFPTMRVFTQEKVES